MFKPVNVTIGTSATLILPAVSPKASDIEEFVAEMALTVGDIITTSTGRLFWCVSSGTAGTTEPDHDDGDAANGAATVRAMSSHREYVALVNHGAQTVYLGLGDPAELNKGIMLAPNGGSVEFKREDGQVPPGKIWGIVSTGTSIVGIQVG